MKNFLRKLLPRFVINIYHWKMAYLANLIYGFPSKGMRVIGVTGTNGKTTTCFLIRSILMSAERSVGMLTTVAFGFDKKLEQNQLNMTTISPFLMQKYLRRMRKMGCTDVVIETTSHAVAQHRTCGIHYDILALTNITHDHLDYHGSMEGYVAAKRSLFEKPHRISVLNRDDESFEEFRKLPAGRKLSYSLKGNADVTARKVLGEAGRTVFTLVTAQGQTAVDLRLPGEFNVANALCATSVALGLDIPLPKIKEGLEAQEQVAGRMEKVTVPEVNLPFTAILDYAHTPDALEKVYESLRDSVRGRIISVLGACGDRDKTKRPILGALAGRFADIVIVTDEEPYTEDPKAILEAVAEGVPRGATKERPKKDGETFFKIPQRGDAIEKAIKLAEKGDLVLVTGMGDQSYRVVGKEHLPWSDREAIQAALRHRMAQGQRKDIIKT